MTDKETLAAYEAKADEYAEKFAATSGENRHVVAFLDGLPHPADLLDLGCGTGNAVVEMAARGHRVTGLDPSEAMLAHARKRAPDATFRVATFDDVTEVAAYDGVYANFSLLHAPRAEFPRHLKAIATSLRPRGRFHIGMKTGVNAARDRLGRHYTYYGEAELRDALATASFTILSETKGASKGLAGDVEPWMILLAEKNA